MTGEVRFRTEKVDGVGPWLWPTEDVTGWILQTAEFPTLRDIILKHTRGRGAIIQAGGCCGLYPRLWSKYFDVVYTFEPEIINFYCLVHNCRGANVFKMQAALGNESANFAVNYGPMINVGTHSIGGSGQVPMLRLDDLAFPHVDVIQLDCEGFEGKVLVGAQQLIKDHQPLICVELSNPTLRDDLIDIGYEVVDQCRLVEQKGTGYNELSSPNMVFMPSAT